MLVCEPTFMNVSFGALPLVQRDRRQKKKQKEKRLLGEIAPRAQKQALRCWEKLDWAAWR